MTTHPNLAVKDQFTGKEFREPAFDKAEAQGKQLALLALNAMENPVEKIDSAGMSYYSFSYHKVLHRFRYNQIIKNIKIRRKGYS